LGRFWQAWHPPRYAAFNQSSSPKFLLSSGWLTAAVLTVDALDTPEDHILLAGLVNGDGADEAEALSDDVAMRLLTLAANTKAEVVPPIGVSTDLAVRLGRRQKEIQGAISERNARFFEAEADKVDGWADDLKVGLEREIKEIDRQIREARRAATAALTLEEKLAGQKEIRALEVLRNTKRRTLFDAQDEIDKQRTNLIAQIEVKLEQKAELVLLFTIRWTVL